MSLPPQAASVLERAAEAARDRAAGRLAGLQAQDAHWSAELTADASLESDYVLFLLWRHPPRNGQWQPDALPLVRKAVQSILDRQLPDGGFGIYAQGPSEVGASVKAYAALKLGGLPADLPSMERLRGRILELGGIQAAPIGVKFDLSLFHLFPRRGCPSLPPEAWLLPFGLPNRIPSWARATLVPLSVLYAANPRRPVPAGIALDELWLPGAGPARFSAVDRLLKWWDRHGSAALRRKAMRKAGEWIAESLSHPDAFHPTMYSVMALDVLGYAEDHPLRAEALRQFDRLMVDGQRFLLPPAPDAAPGNPAVPPSIDGLLAMQSRDGGCPAFGAANYGRFASQPPCADITGRVLEALAACGVDRGHPAVLRGVQWLVRNQEPDGSWYGRWGVAYIYGTCFALRGLAAAGESDREAHILRAGEWLRSVQNADGGWGETCVGCDHAAFAPAPSSPSHTALAILGLVAGGDAASLSVRQGIRFLADAQRPDGSWDEPLAGGTGFPKVFYLNYHLYKDYFPLLALSAFVKARNGMD